MVTWIEGLIVTIIGIVVWAFSQFNIFPAPVNKALYYVGIIIIFIGVILLVIGLLALFGYLVT